MPEFVHVDHTGRTHRAGKDDMSRDGDDSTGHPRYKGKGKEKDTGKRLQVYSISDSESELDIPISKTMPAYKKRKIADDSRDNGNDSDHASNAPGLHKWVNSARGKAKQIQREDSVDSISTTPKQRKKLGPRKKFDTLPPQTQELLGIAGTGSTSASVAGDLTPSASRPASPALTSISATVYELDEPIPALRKAKKVDDTVMMKRVRNLEEAQRKVWTNIARRDIPKVSLPLVWHTIGLLTTMQVYKFHAQGYMSRQNISKRLATHASIHARKPYVKAGKALKDTQAKGKRLMREMLVFWKKNEKEERDVRRREQREALDRARIEEEKREATRQARKLEFLISQTELYSHFVGNKLKSKHNVGRSPVFGIIFTFLQLLSLKANSRPLPLLVPILSTSTQPRCRISTSTTVCTCADVYAMSLICFQTITQTFIDMRGTTRRLLLPSPNERHWTSIRRPLWSARQTRR